VIVCADDFAFNEPVSLAVLELAKLGRVSATSAMVLSPRWPADAAMLRDLRGSIDVGLHLDWTSALAVAAGHGISLGRAMLRSLLRGFEATQVTQVIARQLDAFEAEWKAPPDHVDGHQHVHQFAGIREPLLDLLDQRYGAGRGPYLRISRPAGGGGLKGTVIGLMGATAIASGLQARGRGASPALTGLYGFDGSGADYAAHALRWLQDAPAGAVLMCHPAVRALPGDDIGEARRREFEFWRSDRASEVMAQAGAAPARGPGPIRSAH
jgi:chitin disaccharide deacetylase